MSRKSTACLHVPGESEWEFWEKGKRISSEPSGPCLHCFEARAVFAVPLWISSAENERIEPIVQMQMEGHGLAREEVTAGRHLDHWIVARNGSRTQVLAMWLPEDRDAWPVRPEAFAVSPQLYEAPRNRILLWRELDRWVIAFTRGERLAYFQALSGGELDDDLIAEIRCIRESMEAGGFVETVGGIEIGDSEVSGKTAGRIGDALNLPAERIARPVPAIPEEISRLLPASVASRRESLAKQRRLSRFILIGAAVYLAVIGVFIAYLFQGESRNRETRDWIDRRQPEVAAARQDRLRWNFVKPALDRDRYPLEIFHRVVSLLPEEGIRLTYFEVDLDRILIRGEASSSTEAITWKNRLLSTAESGGLFEGCRWLIPQPDILPDNRATFTAEGTWTSEPNQP